MCVCTFLILNEVFISQIMETDPDWNPWKERRHCTQTRIGNKSRRLWYCLEVTPDLSLECRGAQEQYLLGMNTFFWGGGNYRCSQASAASLRLSRSVTKGSQMPRRQPKAQRGTGYFESPFGRVGIRRNASSQLPFHVGFNLSPQSLDLLQPFGKNTCKEPFALQAAQDHSEVVTST